MVCFIAWSAEYAEHGTIRDHLAATKRGWSPVRARREIVALLKLLDQLHGAGALHRDITPTNVFVCKNKKLKLGDFGLARTVLAGKMLTASAFTPFFVSKRMAEGERRHWLPSDDVFQMGQLLAMLLARRRRERDQRQRRGQAALQRRPARDRGQGHLRPAKPLCDGARHASSAARA